MSGPYDEPEVMIQVSIVTSRVLDRSLDEGKDTTGEVKGVTSVSQRTWHPGAGSDDGRGQPISGDRGTSIFELD
jgi:hypothetical protein